MFIPKILKQRSSWPSSFVTGLIGWNGLVLIAALAFAYPSSLGKLLGVATLSAVLQVTILRLLFFPLRMEKSVWVGTFWGALTAGLLVFAEYFFVEAVRHYFLISLLTGIYIGGPVGAFLSYFYRDDRRIESKAGQPGVPVDYGRDGHWLDPFLYGAVAYVLVFLPRTVDLALSAAIVGSFTGVVAAGVSHFFLSRFDNALWTIPLATLSGALFGAVTGFLFRNFDSELFLPPLIVGAIAGGLTFSATASVGRIFAQREQKLSS